MIDKTQLTRLLASANTKVVGHAVVPKSVSAPEKAKAATAFTEAARKEMNSSEIVLVAIRV